MARTPYDGALGHNRSGGGARHGGASGKGVPRHVLPAGAKNHSVPQFATRYSGWTRGKKRNRQHWTAMNFDLRSRAVAEFLGTAFLLAAVVGSGIMGERLSGGNVAIALLANTLSTGAILMVLVLVLDPISGAHFNPAVTLAMSVAGDFPLREAPVYFASQIAGAFVGVASAHLMFSLPLFFVSTHVRQGGAQLWSETVATFGLLFVIWSCSRFRPSATAYA